MMPTNPSFSASALVTRHSALVDRPSPTALLSLELASPDHRHCAPPLSPIAPFLISPMSCLLRVQSRLRLACTLRVVANTSFPPARSASASPGSEFCPAEPSHRGGVDMVVRSLHTLRDQSARGLPSLVCSIDQPATWLAGPCQLNLPRSRHSASPRTRPAPLTSRTIFYVGMFGGLALATAVIVYKPDTSYVHPRCLWSCTDAHLRYSSDSTSLSRSAALSSPMLIPRHD